jgi:hypothetical protein
MKLLSLVTLLAFVTPVWAEDLPVLAAPDFKSPLDASWKIAHGTYEPKDGVLVCAEKPENKHVAVLWHQVGWNSGLIECEFRFDGSKILILGCDGTTPKGLAHIGRVVIGPKMISIAEDSVKPSHTIAKLPADLQSGVWHRLSFAWSGEHITLKVNDLAIHASHAYLATAKTRSWIAVGGQTASIRELKISGKP